MQQMSVHLAEVISRGPDRAVDIALNPEELGRLRLSMVTVDGSLTLAITAERGETLDLIRRHIGQLEQEFRDLGYRDINFSFSKDGQSPQDTDRSFAKSQNTTDPGTPLGDVPVQIQSWTTSGLDLRM